MINFEYDGYTLKYDEFQLKLEVICDYGEVLLDAPNFDLGKMNDIHEHLIDFFNFEYHANKLGEVLDNLREECLDLQKREEITDVYEFLKSQSFYELKDLEALLGGYVDAEE